jgi:hypothetical protein
MILGRSLRVQTTIVLMDGIIRNYPSQCFDDETLAVFTEMGTIIRKMLSISSEGEDGEAVKDLLVERLAFIRTCHYGHRRSCGCQAKLRKITEAKEEIDYL